MTPPRTTIWAALAAVMVLTCGCEREPDPSGPPAPGVLLVVDRDLVVRESDVEPFAEYFEELDPSMGVKYRTRELLQQHLVPLMLARRAFPEQRAAQLEQARAVRATADNSLEFRRRAELLGIRESDRPYTRSDLPLPVAMWAFRPEHLGAVSPPIETARGWVLVSPLDLESGVTQPADRLRALVMPFHTHSRDDFDAWLGRARAEIAGRVDWVAPTIEDALPPTLLKPRAGP